MHKKTIALSIIIVIAVFSSISTVSAQSFDIEDEEVISPGSTYDSESSRTRTVGYSKSEDVIYFAGTDNSGISKVEPDGTVVEDYIGWDDNRWTTGMSWTEDNNMMGKRYLYGESGEYWDYKDNGNLNSKITDLPSINSEGDDLLVWYTDIDNDYLYTWNISNAEVVKVDNSGNVVDTIDTDGTSTSEGYTTWLLTERYFIKGYDDNTYEVYDREDGSYIDDFSVDIEEYDTSGMDVINGDIIMQDAGTNDALRISFSDVDLLKPGESTNQNPEINSFNVTPDSFSTGDNLTYDANVSDPDGSIEYTNLTVTECGNTVVEDEQRTGTTPEWKDIHTVQDTCWINATIETVDDDGAVTTKELNTEALDEEAMITDTDIRINKTSHDTGKPSPWTLKPFALIENFDTSTDTANLTVYDNNDSEYLYNLSSEDVTFNYDENDGFEDRTGYNFTAPTKYDIVDRNASYTYNYTIYDSSRDSISYENFTMYHANDLEFNTSIPTGFNGTTLEDSTTYNGFTTEWLNYHIYIDASNVSVSWDIRENGTTEWVDIDTRSRSVIENDSKITSGTYNTGLNSSNIQDTFYSSDKSFEVRTTYKYYNATTDNVIAQESVITTHETTNVDSVLFNSFSEALQPVEDFLGDIVDTLLEIAKDIIYGIVSWIVEGLNIVIDAIVTTILAFINILTYMLSAIIETIGYLFTLVTNWHQQILLVDNSDNSTIDLNGSDYDITAAIDNGFRLESNETLEDYIIEENKTLTDVLANLESKTIYEYDMRSYTLNGTPKNIDTFEDGDYTNNPEWDDVKTDFDIFDVKIDNSTSYNGDKSVLFNKTGADVGDGYLIYNRSGNDNAELHDEEKYTFYSKASGGNHYFILSDTTDYTENAVEITCNAGDGCKAATHFKSGGEEDSTDWLDNDINQWMYHEITFNTDDETVGYVLKENDTIVADKTLDYHDVDSLNYAIIQASAGYPNKMEAWFDDVTYTGAENVGTRNVDVAYWVNPYDYPSGYPYGVITVFGILSALITFFLSLIPSSIIEAVDGMFEYTGLVVSNILATMEAFTSLFAEVYGLAAGNIKELISVFAIWKGFNYAAVIMDALDDSSSKTFNEAASYVMDDIKNNLLTIQEVMYRSIEILTRIIQATMILLQTIKAMLWWR